jgi:hypothetical protein
MDDDARMFAFRVKYDQVMKKFAELYRGGLRPRPLPPLTPRPKIHPVVKDLIRRILHP